MTTNPLETKRALSSEDGTTWQQSGSVRESAWPAKADSSVVKLVLGSLDEAKKSNGWGDMVKVLESGIKSYFPNLTHLHLWGLPMEKLGPLPENLQVLDVRKCALLENLREIPDTLTELILGECPALSLDEAQSKDAFPYLFDLSLRDLRYIPPTWLNRVLGKSPGIRFLEIAGSEDLLRIDEWPSTLEVIKIHACPKLEFLPEGWPAKLRRLELSDSRISSLDPLPDTAYLNFCGMRELHQLPQRWERARTLFLFRSGVQEPPASEHGEDRGFNSAPDVKDYFAERKLTGSGDVRRCKVLLLGNGGAGKTSLSLTLAKKLPLAPEEKRPESTHGIQFWPLVRHVPVEKEHRTRTCKVQVHVWDFGGQELYHDVHRLFMEKGSVFVVLWNRHEPKKAKERKQSGYTDDYRPLKYWFDLIRSVCPHNPRISVVCSRSASVDEATREALLREIGDAHFSTCQLFAVDSDLDKGPCGEISKLEEWLSDAVGKTISTQGTVVPSYWVLAQDMVEGWIKELLLARERKEPTPEHLRQMTLDQFQTELLAVIQRERKRFPELDCALEENRFTLNEKRTMRTLRFLTQSGWVYWNEEFPERRVLIGQEWALAGIYSFLRRDAEFYDRLVGKGGRFTDTDFQQWILSDCDYSDNDRQLLLRIMVHFGFLIQIEDKQRWNQSESVFLSVRHLPGVTSEDVTEYTSVPDALDENVTTRHSALFHRANWLGILATLGAEFGGQASYYRDAFLLNREDGSDAFLRVEYHPAGIGASITIALRGLKPGDDSLKGLVELVEGHFPESEEKKPQTSGLAGPRAMEVFISYTWDQQTGDTVEGGYEEPVVAIESMLKEIRGVDPIRDRTSMVKGESILEFMKSAASNCQLFVMIQSDKYWMSPNCVAEVYFLDMSLKKVRKATYSDVLIGVEHIPDNPKVNEIFRKHGLTKSTESESPIHWLIQFWQENPPQLGAKYADEISQAKLNRAAPVLIETYIPFLDDALGANHKWKYGKDKVLAAIREKVMQRLDETREERLTPKPGN